MKNAAVVRKEEQKRLSLRTSNIKEKCEKNKLNEGKEKSLFPQYK